MKLQKVQILLLLLLFAFTNLQFRAIFVNKYIKKHNQDLQYHNIKLIFVQNLILGK